jgi:hypothetical protein
MSPKIAHLFGFLSIRWPYLLATAIALAFVISKGLSFLRETRSIFLRKWSLRRLDLSKLRVELASAEGDLKEKPRFKKIDGSAHHNPVNRNRWLVRIGIANMCVGLLVLLVWLFRR